MFEMDEDECGFGNVAYLAGAHHDVLEDFPAFAEKGEASFAEAAQGTEQGVSRAGIDTEFGAVFGLFHRSMDAVPSDMGARCRGPVRGRSTNTASSPSLRTLLNTPRR